MFEKVEPSVNYVMLEHKILEFWKTTDAFNTLRKKNADGPVWSFLDGPITANNPMGVHHAWGRTYKDCFQRYHGMLGHQLRYQNGFDCQGLWVEVEVEKELGFQTKRDIEAYGLENFVKKCKERVQKYSQIQTQQSIRLGFWMDWDHSYYTMSDENNYAIWAFLKKCHNRKLIYKAFDAMPWCPRCSVGISQMEMHEGYRLTADTAVFVAFPLRDRPGEHLLVWTTTPWTLSSNVAAAVNADLTYVKIKCQDRIFYLAQGAFTAQRKDEAFKSGEWVDGVPKLKTIEQVFKERGGFDIVGHIRGQEMVGWSYESPYDHLHAQQQKGGFPESIAKMALKSKWASDVTASQAHRIIAWDIVGELEGTGIVHIAPGCGKEDFELGKDNQLPPIAPLDDMGVFLDGFGFLSGRSASHSHTTEFIVQDLKNRGFLVSTEQYPHNYPHCWRCRCALLFRLVDEWYINMDWRDEIKAVAKNIHWIPEWGLDRELDWLTNMRDWLISKKRYWGLALPVFECECGWFDVVGSKQELKERAVQGWDRFEDHSPHRPWVDHVQLQCPKCQALVSRVPDVGNPWLDAGIVPYSTVKYFEDRDYWQRWIPADLVTECFPGQFRNWFYALLAMSTMLENIHPFKTLLGHALVRDEKGFEMHKSAGNAIWFEDAAEKMGVDVMRWVFCRHNPVHNLNFGYGVGEQIRRKVFNTLWNVYSFFSNYARLDGFDPTGDPVDIDQRQDMDRWLLAKLQHLVGTATDSFSNYDVSRFVMEAEHFIDDLSNWYVRRCRRRFWRPKNQDDQDKLAAYQTLYETLVTLCKVLAPVIPFVTEVMYQNLVRNATPDACESVHHCDYPKVDPTLENKSLVDAMDVVAQVVRGALSLREVKGLRVRQPLAHIHVCSHNDRIREALQRFEEHILDELNIKKLVLVDTLDDLVVFEVKPNFQILGSKLGKQLKSVAAAIKNEDSRTLAQKIQSGQTVRVAGVDLAPEDFVVEETPHPNWATTTVGDATLALDLGITPDLKREGLARDVVRHIQQLRKERDLESNARIRLSIHTDDTELQMAIQQFEDTIKSETLCSTLTIQTMDEGKKVRLSGKDLTLDLVVEG